MLIVFDDIMAYILSNNKINLTELFIRGKKLDISHTILFCCVKKHLTKLYALLYYENSKQTGASTNYI